MEKLLHSCCLYLFVGENECEKIFNWKNVITQETHIFKEHCGVYWISRQIRKIKSDLKILHAISKWFNEQAQEERPKKATLQNNKDANAINLNSKIKT